MKEFAAKHDDLRMSAMIVPNASLVMRDYLPANAPAHNQQEDLFTVNQALSPCMQYADGDAGFESPRQGRRFLPH